MFEGKIGFFRVTVNGSGFVLMSSSVRWLYGVGVLRKSGGCYVGPGGCEGGKRCHLSNYRYAIERDWFLSLSFSGLLCRRKKTVGKSWLDLQSIFCFNQILNVLITLQSHPS